LKAISLWEPWASLIAAGAKKWKTRCWKTDYRGELLICAARFGLGKIEMEDILSRRSFQMSLQPLLPDWNPPQADDPLKVDFEILFKAHHLNFGKAVAIVNLTDCIPTYKLNVVEHIRGDLPFGDFSPRRFGWKLENIRRIKEPFPVKGRQGFFNVELPEGIELINIT
jgi:hypothetical protein